MVARELAVLLPPMPVGQQYKDDRAKESREALELATRAFVPIPKGHLPNRRRT